MTIHEQATELIRSAYFFIAKKQTKAGGFTSHTCTEHGQEAHQTTFYPALICSILAEIKKDKQAPEHNLICERLKNFWLLQPDLKQPSWCTYWAIQDQCYHTNTYPPDLDDSSLVLLSKQHIYTDKDFSNLCADYVITLTKQEQKPGGPYRTWMENNARDPWTDYDPIVNATINYTLKKWNVNLGTLQNYLLDAIKNDSWRSPYYTSDYLSLYLIIRSLSNEQNIEIKKYIVEIISNNPPKSSMDTACALLISTRLGITHMSGLEKKFFSIKTSNFTAEPCIRERANAESGSDVLTAALWALAASEFMSQSGNNHFVSNDKNETELIHDSATNLVVKKLHSLDKFLFESSLSKFCTLIQTPVAREITLLSHDIGVALKANLDQKHYTILGAANLFGWLAFMWYDECYDEKIISVGLPIANICLREAVQLYTQVAKDYNINTELINEIFDGIDCAHATEISNNYELQTTIKSGKKITFLPSQKPSERSFGHCLGPLIIAKFCKLPETQYQQIYRLFNHYLTTRQLCDDLHDWYEDYQAKRLTSVTRYLFLTTQLFPSVSIDQTQKIFWHEGINQAITNTKHELQQTISLMRVIEWPNSAPNQLSQTINKISLALLRANSERKTAQNLLNYFQHEYEPF